MQDKENKNVIVMDTVVDQDIDAARIMLMMDMHQSLEDMNIANSDDYLDKSIKLGWDKQGNRVISTNVGVCDTVDVKGAEGEKVQMYCISVLDVIAIDEFISTPINVRNTMNPALLTKNIIKRTEKNFRKFLKLEKEANARANSESGTRNLNEFLKNLGAVKGLFFFMNHNALIAEHPKDKIYFVTIYNNCNKYNSATFTLSNSIKSEIMEKATEGVLIN
jgi:hypothetical protein